MMQKRWAEKPYDTDKAAGLARALGVADIYARLLVQRNIETYEDARHFFLPGPAQLHDAWRMRDMGRAVERIDRARKAGEKVLVYGDYDVDGVTSVALLYGFLCEEQLQAGFYVPHRHREGYGLSARGIDYAVREGYTLLIALDCGIKATAAVSRAGEKGVDVIICDHHLPEPGRLPEACAILNPKRADCDYPYPELSACAVGFKLITALVRQWSLDPAILTPYLQLTALSIAADVVPMTGENRVLTRMGLESLQAAPLPGLKALLAVSRTAEAARTPLSTEDLTYLLAPRLNAAGRLGEAADAVCLLTEKDEAKALEAARLLHTANQNRRTLDQDMTTEALALMKTDITTTCTTVVYHPEWHKGVIGIVAARLLESCYRPTIVLTRSGDMVTGSARSVAGFNIAEALHACKDLLENYGGHYYAAGMTLRAENLEAFRKRFEAVAAQHMQAGPAIPEIAVDATLRLADIQPNFFNTLKRFEPFGPGNREPVFIAYGLRDTGGCRIIKSDHIRFEVTQQASPAFAGIGFRLAEKFGIIASGHPFDLCFQLAENRWRGRTSLQLKVLDLRPSESAVS